VVQVRSRVIPQQPRGGSVYAWDPSRRDEQEDLLGLQRRPLTPWRLANPAQSGGRPDLGRLRQRLQGRRPRSRDRDRRQLRAGMDTAVGTVSERQQPWRAVGRHERLGRVLQVERVGGLIVGR